MGVLHTMSDDMKMGIWHLTMEIKAEKVKGIGSKMSGDAKTMNTNEKCKPCVTM